MRSIPAALTMMETVVSLVLIAIVFAAVIPQFGHIRNSWASRQGKLDTVQNGRTLTEFINRRLASAVKVLAVSDPSDTRGFIEYVAEDGKTFRFSLSADNYVQFGEPKNLSDLAGPVGELKFLCYALENLDQPVVDVDSIRFVKAVATFSSPSRDAASHEYVSSAFLYSGPAAESGYLYWTDDNDNAIERIVMGGGDIEAVVSGLKKPAGLAVDIEGGRIYWADNHAGQIARAALNGANRTNLVSTDRETVGLSLDLRRGKMYWADNHAGKIRRANLDGSGVEDAVSGISRIEYDDCLRLDDVNGRVYWAQTKAGGEPASIRRANLNGSDLRDIVVDAGKVTGIALDTNGGKLYWADKSDRVIRRANLDGSDARTIITNVYELTAIELDIAGRKLYWADRINRSIARASVDGSAVENLVFAADEPVSLALDIDAGKMYWADGRRRRIRQADLDGANIATVTTAAGQPGLLRLGGSGVTVRP